MPVTGSKPSTDRISVQVALSGYLVRMSENKFSGSSEWAGAECFFTAPEFRKRYDEVEISLFTPKFALVPEQFFSPESAKAILSDTADVADTDLVEYVSLPSQMAVLIYSNTIGETLSKVVADTVLYTDGSSSKVYPEVYHILRLLPEIGEYNKVVAAYADGRLYMVVAQGKTLNLCNSFDAPDFVTAQYFIFHVLKKLQINPEMTTIYFRTPLSEQEEMSFYKYFKGVDYL